MSKVSLEVFEHKGVRYAEVIRAESRVEITKFFSPPESSFQFGLLAHEAGFVEAPHFHKEFERTIRDLQQMFVVQRGVVDVVLYDDEGYLIETVRMKQGDAIVLIHGVHAIKVIEDMQCISVKQGPFLGAENDKIMVSVKN
ncbi:MAG TPA: hypothetical protein VI548_00920 [Chitinophagaceae bacterium]|nr:hypothetical protein [Chitinophagaceae bacterium]